MRKRQRNRLLMIGLCLVTLVIATGCATTTAFRAAPQLQEKLTSIKTVAIMPPNIKVYQIPLFHRSSLERDEKIAAEVGGVGLGLARGATLMDEETATAKQIVATAIEKELERHEGIVFKPFSLPSAVLDASGDLGAASLKDELEDTQALFEVMRTSIHLHTYGPVATGSLEGRAYDETFLEKLKNFDYSLGPDVERLAKLANADALLFISGGDFRYSEGARAAMIPLAILALSIAGVVGPYAGPTSFNVALVDATTGALLWYNGFTYGRILLSPTDSEAVAQMLEWVFYDFPLGTRPTQTRLEYEGGAWSRTSGSH